MYEVPCMIKEALSAGAGYLLGSLNSGVILSKLGYLDDIRRHGSGNAGATNMARVFGWGAGILTLGCDVGKSVASMAIGKKLGGDTGLAAAGAGCLAGHCWPAYHHFKGGKGVSVGVGIALMTGPAVFYTAAGAFAAGALATKKVSVGSVCAAIMLPLSAVLFKASKPKQLLCAGTAAVVLWEHRPNIRRLLNRTEPDFKAGRHRRFGAKA